MKPLQMSLIACAVAAFSGTALASSGSLVNFKPQVLPVVVQVNSQGRVTDINPALQLRPWLKKMLVEQIDAWIVKPVMVKGHPVASRFIIEVAMHTRPSADGKYDASFVYVRSLPLAYHGMQHWNVIDGGLRFALVPNDLQQPRGNAYFPGSVPYEPSVPGSMSQSQGIPAMASQPAPAAQPAATAAGSSHTGKP